MQKLDSEVFKSLFNKELSDLFNVFKKYNYELKIAGGAVRDLLMNLVPKDIDLATNATPVQMNEMFNIENMRTLNKNGEKHGTVTVRINDKENFEITTLRIDVTTDGRHAQVQFTNDWKLDANRRDLTINSIFLDENGMIYDFFNGVNDLKERKVNFVGDPDQRIKEDYLRILRFFRFYGRIADKDNNFDQKAIDAIRENASGLQGIHGERIWLELKKIIVGNFADSIVKKMIELDVHLSIGLPNNPNINEFCRVYERNKSTNNEYDISPVTMIFTLMNTADDIEKFARRVKFSNEEKKLAEFLFTNSNCNVNNKSDDYLKPYKNILVDSQKDLKIYEKLHELLLYQGQADYIKILDAWNVPIFPINGDTLVQKGLERGPLFSKILNELKEIWKNEFNFEANESTLLNIFENLKEKYKK